jgi:hypothetical protein
MLVADLVRRGISDPKQIYLSGLSLGGVMALRMACVDAGSFAAIGLLISAMPDAAGSDCHPSKPLPVLMINGTGDRIVPYAGGQSQRGDNLWPTERLVAFFRQLNGCAEAAQQSVLPGQHPQQIEIERSTRCSGGPVILYRIIGGGHDVPSGLNAGQLLLDFFRDKVRDDAGVVVARPPQPRADADAAKKAENGTQAAAEARRKDEEAVAVRPANPKEARATMPPNLNKQFSIVQGAAVKGEEYRIVHETTLASCTETCTNERSCIMFSHWKNGVCYLFNTRFDTYPTVAAVVGKCLSGRGNAPTEPGLTDKRFRITRDVAVKGDEYRTFRETTFERCANQCADDARCKVFAHWKNDRCYLFSEYSDTYPSTETRVGSKIK